MRFLTPKYDSRPKPIPPGAVEMCVVDSWCFVDAAGKEQEGAGNREFRSASILVRLTGEKSLEAFGGLARMLPTSRVVTCSTTESDCARTLREILADSSFDAVTLVLHVDPGAATSPRVLDGVIEIVQKLPESVVIMVGDGESEHRARQGIDGFVRGAAATSVYTAIATLLLFEALSAPETLICLDREDVEALLGAADAPSTLCEGVWSKGSGRMLYANSADEAAVATSGRLTINVLATTKTSDLQAMVNCIRAQAPPDCYVSYQAPVNWIEEGFGMSAIVPVHILCRPQTLCLSARSWHRPQRS